MLMLPCIALITYSAMVLLPIPGVVKIMKIAENSTDYPINNTARQVLLLPIGSNTKFHGKPAIDTLSARIGYSLAAITVLVGIHMLALSARDFFLHNIILVLL